MTDEKLSEIRELLGPGARAYEVKYLHIGRKLLAEVDRLRSLTDLMDRARPPVEFLIRIVNQGYIRERVDEVLGPGQGEKAVRDAREAVADWPARQGEGCAPVINELCPHATPNAYGAIASELHALREVAEAARPLVESNRNNLGPFGHNIEGTAPSGCPCPWCVLWRALQKIEAVRHPEEPERG